MCYIQTGPEFTVPLLCTDHGGLYIHALWRGTLLHGTRVAHTNLKPCVEAKFDQVTLSGKVQDVLRTEINLRSLVTY